MPAEENFHKRETIPPSSHEKNLDESPPPVPKEIGPYKIERMLDKGGMSFLYVAKAPEIDSPLIIKVLSPKFLTNKEIEKRFLNEAEIIRLADHPNIIKLYGSGTWEGGLYIAMEYIEGISLRKLLESSPLTIKRSIEIILEIAYALVHLHTHHVIHRDLKPENILITPEGHVKVIDFGIAELMHKKNQEGPSKRFIGTPIYISPEQRENPENVSYPSDIYSLGIIAYELILGRLSQGQVHLSLMPKGIRPILAKALNPDPKERYHDAVDFIGDLLIYLHSAEIEKDKKPLESFSEQYNLVLTEAKKILQKEEKERFEVALSPTFAYPTLMWSYFESGDKKRLVILEASDKNPSSFLHYLSIYGFLKSQELIALNEMIPTLNKYLYESFSSPILGAIVEKNREEISLISFGDVKILSGDKEIKPSLPLGVDPIYPNQPSKILKSQNIFIHTLKELSLPIKGLDDMLRVVKLRDPKYVEERNPYLFKVSLP